MKHSITGWFMVPKGTHVPCHMKFWSRVWWRFMPGVTVNVRWPQGMIQVDHNDPRWQDWGGAVWIQFPSTDPNDHYRPWLEQHVGRQGWDWDWGMIDNDVTDNRLTIKFRRKHRAWATVAGLQWQ